MAGLPVWTSQEDNVGYSRTSLYSMSYIFSVVLDKTIKLDNSLTLLLKTVAGEELLLKRPLGQKKRTGNILMPRKPCTNQLFSIQFLFKKNKTKRFIHFFCPLFFFSPILERIKYLIYGDILD